ncbi:hypothetical protein, partial [Klebsiella aerogenes]
AKAVVAVPLPKAVGAPLVAAPQAAAATLAPAVTGAPQQAEPAASSFAARLRPRPVAPAAEPDGIDPD